MASRNAHAPLFVLALPAVFLLLCNVLQTQASDVYYSIKEELSPGTVFGNVVQDSDLQRKVSPDDLNKLRFSFLTTENPNSKFFSINSKTGQLSVASKIDRETVCSFRQDCQLTVRAVVQMELGSFFHIIAVHVEITDVNDNPPTFSQALFEVNIPENAPLGVTYPLPTAFDKDTGVNNTDSDSESCCYPYMVKDYFLVSGHPTFSLSTTQDDVGNIQTALQLLRELNREETATITVLVGARDGGRPPLTGTLTVRVNVADVNDNYPKFDRYDYKVNVSETTRTNDPLLRIQATDADEGLNGNLTYSFSKLQPREVLDLFRMDAVSGTMYLARSVENHTGSIFELVVEASDRGSPPKVSRALVRVRVLDTVNSRPDIIVDILRSSSDGQAEASEYAEVGKVVAYVSVNDPDSGENGVTVCRLNTKDFELQPLNNQGQYKVILVTNLDRERIARYQISVRCNDFGFPQLENSKTFQVIVRDENDNAPQFSTRSYYTSMQENGTAGALVAQLTVRDADEGQNAEVVYRVAGAHRNEFKILDNGTMIATAPLDREVSEKLVVKVIAIDQGYPPLSGSATVFVTLEDVNDMAPRFSDKGYSFSVAEDARVGSFVGIVAAEDDDQGRNAEITFMAADGDSAGRGAFIITKEGVVKTNRLLDREKEDCHYFTVVARDGGDPPLSTTTTVTIHVDDVNDNTPYFTYPTEANDSLSIPHTFPVRTAITQIRATDRDAGQNSALVYSCASANDSGLFGVDPSSGDLFLTRYMSQQKVGLYILRVAAHDEGTPQLSNQTLLFVDVFFDNSTLLDASQAAAPSKAVMTALILVGVVLIVGGVAITVLICIRRQEAKKKQEAASAGQAATTPTKLQGGYYIAPGVCESPAFGGGLSNGEALNKPVPEQSMDGSGVPPPGIGMCSDVSNHRSANPYVIMPPHSNYTDAEGPPEIIEISRSGLFHRAEDPYPVDDSDQGDESHFSTFRSQDGALGPNFRQNSLPRHSVDDMDDAKRADDTLSLSELSYQSTSDSGRGGSEFDVNNAGHKEKAAAMQNGTSPFKGGHHHHHQGNNNNNGHNTSIGSSNNTSGGTFRPRDPEVSFTTFRGESPCSFRFDSDNDTLTRGHRQGSASRTSPLPLSSSHHLQPHARSLHSVAGAATPSAHFRPVPPYYGMDSASSDEAGSLGRRGGGAAARRAVTPGADLSAARHGYAPVFNFSTSTPNRHEHYGVRGEGGGGGGGGVYTDAERSGRPLAGTSTFTSPPPYGHPPEYGAHHHSHTVPPVEFRGRNNLGGGGYPTTASSTSRHPMADYVNAYSDLDSGDDTRHGGELEPTEDDFLLPPYPQFEAVEEGEEGEMVDGEGEVSERSALNFVPGVSSLSRTSDDSYRARRSSEV